MVEVVNIGRVDDYDVYIGRAYNGHRHMNNTRPGLKGWLGNPYKVGEDGGREEVIEKFREDFYEKLETDEEFRKKVEQLEGTTLACYCKPKACHGDVIKEYIQNKASTPGGGSTE